MKAHIHILINALIGLTILIFLKSFSNFILFVLGGIVFDIDHYIYHVFKERNFSLARFKNIHVELSKNKTLKFYIFHTFEFSILFLVIALFFFPQAVFLSYGLILHMILDAIYYIRYYHNLSWIKHWSLVWNIKNPEK